RHQPAALVLSRQPLPTLDRQTYAPAAGVARGAYVLADAPGGSPDVILIASGSELSLAVEAHGQLLAEGIRSRVVSMPSWEIFDQQSQEYRDSVLPPGVTARVAVEQGSTFGWEGYVGAAGHGGGVRRLGGCLSRAAPATCSTYELLCRPRHCSPSRGISSSSRNGWPRWRRSSW